MDVNLALSFYFRVTAQRVFRIYEGKAAVATEAHFGFEFNVSTTSGTVQTAAALTLPTASPKGSEISIAQATLQIAAP